MFDWNSCYMECSAKVGGERVHQVFLELLQQVRNNVEEAGGGPDTAHFTTNNFRRRKSLPQVVRREPTNQTLQCTDCNCLHCQINFLNKHILNNKCIITGKKFSTFRKNNCKDLK